MDNEAKIEKIRFPHLASEIKKMVEKDQAMRTRSETEDYWDAAVDTENTKRMGEIVDEIGWPTISNVGEEGSNGAWLLVQHADRNINFQIHCLKLMKNTPPSEIDTTNIAYLEDRIRVNQGKGQLYGTQFIQKDNQHIPLKIEDEANVDARRAEVGLGPLAEQIELMYEKYPFTKKE